MRSRLIMLVSTVLTQLPNEKHLLASTASQFDCIRHDTDIYDPVRDFVIESH